MTRAFFLNRYKGKFALDSDFALNKINILLNSNYFENICIRIADFAISEVKH
jgi:hypothetical protein